MTTPNSEFPESTQVNNSENMNEYMEVGQSYDDVHGINNELKLIEKSYEFRAPSLGKALIFPFKKKVMWDNFILWAILFAIIITATVAYTFYWFKSSNGDGGEVSFYVATAVCLFFVFYVRIASISITAKIANGQEVGFSDLFKIPGFLDICMGSIASFCASTLLVTVGSIGALALSSSLGGGIPLTLLCVAFTFTIALIVSPLISYHDCIQGVLYQDAGFAQHLAKDGRSINMGENFKAGFKISAAQWHRILMLTVILGIVLGAISGVISGVFAAQQGKLQAIDDIMIASVVIASIASVISTISVTKLFSDAAHEKYSLS